MAMGVEEKGKRWFMLGCGVVYEMVALVGFVAIEKMKCYAMKCLEMLNELT